MFQRSTGKMPRIHALLVAASVLFTLEVQAQFTVDTSSFRPTEASYLGKSEFTFRGTGLNSSLRVTVGQQTLTGNQLSVEEGGTLIRGTFPAYNAFPGGSLSQNVVVRDLLRNTVTIPNAFRYIGYLGVDRVYPGFFPENSSTEVQVEGVAFTPETILEVQDLDGVRVATLRSVRILSPRLAEAVFPSGLSAGRYYVAARDERSGETVNGRTRVTVDVSSSLPIITGVDPEVLPTSGGIIRLTGRNLSSASFSPRLGGQALTNVVRDPDGRWMRGVAPSSDPGTYDLTIFSRTARVYGPYEPQVTYRRVPTIVSVSPPTISPLEEILIVVAYYEEGTTRVTIDGQELVNPQFTPRPQRVEIRAPFTGAGGGLSLIELHDPLIPDSPEVREIEVRPSGCPAAQPATRTSTRFRRGDVNHDGRIEICDANLILEHVVDGGSRLDCRDAADVDDDGDVDVVDAIFLYQNLDGFPTNCVVDETPDALGPCDYDRCVEVVVTSIIPIQFSVLGRSEFVVRGSGLDAVDSIRVQGGLVLDEILEQSDTRLRVEVPSLRLGQVSTASALDFFFLDSSGAELLRVPQAARFWPLSLSSVSPDVIGVTPANHTVLLRGRGFTSRTHVEIVRPGGANQELETTFQAQDRLQVVVPAGNPGERYTLRAWDVDRVGNIVEAELVDAILTESLDPPVITRLSPPFAPARQENVMQLHVENLVPGMRFYVEFEDGSREEVIFEVDEELVYATLPAADPGMLDLAVEVDGGTQVAEIVEILEYVSPTAGTVEDLKVTVIDGAAHFEWMNPVDFETVQVLRNGRIIATLDEGESSFTDLEIGAAGVGDYTFITEDESGDQGRAVVQVAPWLCDPGSDDPVGERGAVDFRLFAGHDSYSPGQGGGGALPTGHQNVQVSPPILRARANQLNPEFVIDPEASRFLTEPNEILTGFRLDTESTKLRVLIHGEQIQAGPDLELRVLIESVTPGVDRVVELIAPVPLGGSGHRWIDFTYNTREPDDRTRASSFPAGAGGEDAPLPAGAYQVRLYATGGTDGEAHFSISSDFDVDQILVPGVGCAPYPLVHVHDTTGLNSRPEVHDVVQIGTSGLDVSNEDGSYAFVATLLAEASDPDGDPIVQYRWRIDMGDEILVRETAADRTCVAFPDYGIYEVEVEARDNRCGRGKSSFLVQVSPFEQIFSLIDGPYPVYAFPSPRPNILSFINDLPGGLDEFDTEVPQTFTFWVLDRSISDGRPSPPRVTHARLALTGQSGGPLNLNGGATAIYPAVPVNPDVVAQGGPANIYTATVPDMGRLRAGVHFTALKASVRYNNGPWTAWRNIEVYSPISGNALFLSSVVPIHDKPAYLDQTGFFSRGTYDFERRCYDFQVDLAPPGGTAHDFGSTEPIDLQLDTVENTIPFPALSNRWMSIRQELGVSFSKGVWSLDRLNLGTDALIANAVLSGDRDLLAAASGAGAGGGAGANFSLPECGLEFDPLTGQISLCCEGEIFDLDFDWGIYSGPIFQGPIGIVNVLVTTSIALRASIAVDAVARLDFDSADPAASRADVWLTPDVRASMPVDISAVLFTGVFDSIFDADFAIDLDLESPVHVGVDSSGPSFDHALSIHLEVVMDWVGCLICPAICPIPTICVGDTDELFQRAEIVGMGDVTDPKFDPRACGTGGGGGQILLAEEAGGGAGPVVQVNPPDRQLSMATSPTGDLQVAIGKDGTSTLVAFYRVRGHEWKFPTIPQLPPGAGSSLTTGPKDSPEVIFINDDVILLAWTQNYANLDPALDDLHPSDGLTVEEFNAIYGRTDIALQAARLVVNETLGEIEFQWSQPVLSHGHHVNGVDPLDDDRADGRPALALRDSQEALANLFWTRYDVADMVSPIDPGQPDAGLEYNLRQTTIFSRPVQVDLEAPVPHVILVPGGGWFSDFDSAIDVEPDASISEGVILAAWIKDEFNDNLHESNVGRNIYYRWRNSTRTIDEEGYVLSPEFVAEAPGIWDVEVALRDSHNGMMIFTALPANAAPDDAGLVNTRLLYYVRFVNGVWQEPELIYRECNTPIFARRATLVMPGEGFEFESAIDLDFGIVFSQPGLPQTDVGFVTFSSNVNADPVLQISPLAPVDHQAQVLDDDVLQIAELEDAVLNIDGSFDALLEIAPPVGSGLQIEPPGGAGGGQKGLEPLEWTFQSGVRFLERAPGNDLAIIECSVTDAGAAPGERETVSFTVKNLGVSARNEGIGSPVRVSVEVDRGEDGREALETRLYQRLPTGEELSGEITFTVPAGAGQVWLRVHPAPDETNLANNARPCQVRPASPSGVRSEILDLDVPYSEEPVPAVRLSWRNEGIYSKIQIIRDGRVLTELPPTATSYVDLGRRTLGGQNFDESHRYQVQAVTGNLLVPVDPREEEEVTLIRGKPFIRGDCNLDDLLSDITDVIFLLEYNFLGGSPPGCPAACDVNGDGDILGVTDAIYMLVYSFRGGPPPVAPFPECGRSGRVTDIILGCPRTSPRCR